jgi:hypothetical protein
MGNASIYLEVAQLPVTPSAAWLGLPTGGQRPPPGRLSLVAHKSPALNLSPGADGTSAISGLLVDDWVEVIPNAKETTGLTFHYQAPLSQAPQSLLLAVSPDPSQPWSLDALEAILLETLDLAKLRSVDSDALGQVGHFIPALTVAFNAHGDAVGENLR